jgi:hypothetical protein
MIAAIAIALAAALLAGCSDEDGLGFKPDRPASAVIADAAGNTLDLKPAEIVLGVRSPQGGYEASGLIEPSEGRFRVNAEGEPSLGQAASVTAVGMPEDDGPVTFREEYSQYEGGPQRCWMGTHSPVGANRATASVQEAVHLTVAALEEMERDVERAHPVGEQEDERHYAVSLLPARADGAGDASFYREASLKAHLSGPVEATVSRQGFVTALRFRLDDYVPVYGWEARRLDPRSGRIDATFATTDDELDLVRPPCMGTE